MTRLTVGWLYPDLMNIYGDRGNVLTLLKRAQWRDLEARLVELPKGRIDGIEEVDIFFFGGGQDREQALVYEDLRHNKALPLERAVAEGAVVLSVCGGYQLLGHHYQTAQGEMLPGLGLLNVHTEAGGRRLIGNVVVECPDLDIEPPTLVGFENHSGRTLLGQGVRPLGWIRSGHGNTGAGRGEGAVSGNLFGTYLHGSLLPKNPHFADHLINLALRRGGTERLRPLDSRLELEAHDQILRREARTRGR